MNRDRAHPRAPAAEVITPRSTPRPRGGARDRGLRAGALRSSCVRRSRRLARRALEEVAGWPAAGGLAERVIDRLRGRPLLCTLSEVLRVSRALETARVPFWLGGGWGIDALWGSQSRPHGDLDLVLDDFPSAVGPLSAVLEGLGYQRCAPRQAGVWWLPEAADFEAPAGRRIEVLGLNWDLLATTSALAFPDGDQRSLRAILRTSCLAQGQLGNHTVPCLSAAAQRLFHTGYHPEGNETRDLALLGAGLRSPAPGTLPATASTSLIIPVFDLDPHTWRVWSEMNPASTLPPHVSLLFPFLPPCRITDRVLSELAELIARARPFTYDLDRVGWFGSSVTYLVPAPAAPFLRLIGVLSHHFDVPPYAAAYPEVIPHVTIGELGRPHRMKRAATRLSRRLPQTCHATEAWLVTETTPGRWPISARFPL